MGFTIIGLMAAGGAAGVITTVGGMGGGLTLLLILSAVAGPMAALSWTAPALLIRNFHRAWRNRSQVDRPRARILVVGGLWGSLAGVLVAVQLPPMVLQLGVVAMAGLAVAKRFGLLRWRATPGLILPLTCVNGAYHRIVACRCRPSRRAGRRRKFSWGAHCSDRTAVESSEQCCVMRSCRLSCERPAVTFRLPSIAPTPSCAE
ncbi:MAG: TSUP family transporter [Myxococcales bacterium]|nr:TSUP family transporter [Myxococcales bacterium]